MNNFTKDELEIITKAMKRGLEFVTVWQEPEYLDVISKIQSLIDNYCEHEHDLDNYDESACKKCGIKLD